MTESAKDSGHYQTSLMLSVSFRCMLNEYPSRKLSAKPIGRATILRLALPDKITCISAVL